MQSGVHANAHTHRVRLMRRLHALQGTHATCRRARRTMLDPPLRLGSQGFLLFIGGDTFPDNTFPDKKSVDLGSNLGRCWVDFGSIWGRFRVAFGSIWGRFGAALGSIWGRFELGLGSIWGRFRVGLLSAAKRGTHKRGLFTPVFGRLSPQFADVG